MDVIRKKRYMHRDLVQFRSNDAIHSIIERSPRESLRNVLCEESGLIYVDPVPFENTEEFYQTEYRKSYKGVHEPKSKHVYRAGKIALERMSRISSFCLNLQNAWMLVPVVVNLCIYLIPKGLSLKASKLICLMRNTV